MDGRNGASGLTDQPNNVTERRNGVPADVSSRRDAPRTNVASDPADEARGPVELTVDSAEGAPAEQIGVGEQPGAATARESTPVEAEAAASPSPEPPAAAVGED